MNRHETCRFLRRLLLYCAAFWLCMAPALGESVPEPVLVGKTGDLHILRLTPENGQELYFTSMEPVSSVLRVDLNGDGLLDLAVTTRMGASNLGQEFFLRSGDAYVPVNRPGSGEEAFYNHVRSADGQYIATNSNNGMAGALFDNYLYTWSGTDLEVVRRAASQPKTEIQVVDSKLITTEYQNVVTIRVQDYSEGVVSGDPIYQAEVNLYDEAALKAAYDAVQALMAFPQ